MTEKGEFETKHTPLKGECSHGKVVKNVVNFEI